MKFDKTNKKEKLMKLINGTEFENDEQTVGKWEYFDIKLIVGK